ncbi:alpha/beta fold hydrolase [Croceicoccus ponticola]|nr:alpha/beta hydrolase [Croceicoccus ponticola]
MAFLETDVGRIHYDHYRSDRAATMVLIHGWGMSGEFWNSAVEALAATGYGAIVIDHRGCGRSDRAFRDMSIDAIAADVAAIVGQCSVDQVVLNGWSLGAAIAVAAASRLGAKVAGLVLTCGATPRYTQADDFPHGGKPEDVLAIAGAITADRPGFFRMLAQGAAAEGANPALTDWFERAFLASGPRASQTLMDLVTLDQRDILSSFAFPVLSIGGKKDGIADPAIAGFAANCARNGKVLMFETGHSPHLEDPARYNAAIIEFMESLA